MVRTTGDPAAHAGALRRVVAAVDPLTVVVDAWALAEIVAESLAGAVAILATVALLSCYIPARRAARLEPVSSLRSE